MPSTSEPAAPRAVAVFLRERAARAIEHGDDGMAARPLDLAPWRRLSGLLADLEIVRRARAREV